MSDSQNTAPGHPIEKADAATDPTLPEAVLLLMFDPRTGAIAGEGQPLMYTLGGAMLLELADGGHIDIQPGRRLGGRTVQAIGPGPEDPLLRDAWDQIARRPADARVLVMTLGPVLREQVIDRLVQRGDLRRTPYRMFGLIPSHRLDLGGTGIRDRLLAPVRAALIDGAEPDARTAALAALLAAGNSLPAMNADIPWSGDVHRRGRALKRGEWGAKAASDAVLANAVVQIASTVFIAGVLPHFDND